MKAGRLIFACLFALSLLGWNNASRATETGVLEPADLAIYYGWPSLVNGISQDNEAAAAVFGDYDIVIFNQGLEEPLHGDSANTAEIISILHDQYSTRVFGYLNGPQWDTSWSVTGMSPVDWETHLDWWVAMGIDGIFVDEFGYDFGITRVMQNAMLDAIHARGLPAFVNSWFIDHTFSNNPDPIFPAGNPAGIESHILPTDLYMLESFTIIEGTYDVCQRPFFDTWLTKADKAVAYRQTFGTEMWTMTTADQLVMQSGDADSAAAEARLSYAWHATAMYGLAGFGWTEPQFSASGPSENLLPWRPRPNPNPPHGIGSAFLNEVQHNADTHTRSTDLGNFRVICNDTGTYLAEFNVTTTPTPTPPPCEIARYDFDGNNIIDIIDIAAVSSRWMDPARYDRLYDVAPVDQPDNVIDIADIALVAVHFGQSCP